MARRGVVVVDGRRDGQHGIARFGREVLQRLKTPSRPLGGPRDALSPLDLVNIDRLRLRPSDLVFSPGFHAGPTRARQLLTLHDLIQIEDRNERDPKKELYYRLIVRPAVLRAGRVLTVSETSRRSIREWLDDAVPVVDVGNGCSDAFFTTDPEPKRSGLLYVGALKPHKNPEIPFAVLAKQRDLRMTVVTNDQEDARRLIARFGVASQVTLRQGLIDAELAKLYAGAAALLFPSLSEGFGLPAAEAIAVGCPVIHWAGCDAVAEIVQEDGYSVSDPHDVVAWTEAASTAEASGIGAAGSARIRNLYSWGTVAERVDREIAAAAA